MEIESNESRVEKGGKVGLTNANSPGTSTARVAIDGRNGGDLAGRHECRGCGGRRGDEEGQGVHNCGVLVVAIEEGVDGAEEAVC